MHLRIIEVAVSPSRVDELGDVIVNKALPVVSQLQGFQGLTYSADRTTGAGVIVGFWESEKALRNSDAPLESIRTETAQAVDGTITRIGFAEVIKEVRVKPSRPGTRTRAVMISAPKGSQQQVVDFYEKQAIPKLQQQQGFLNARLLRDIDNDGQFVAVSHWENEQAFQASEQNSATLREAVANTVKGTEITRVITAELIVVELNKT